MYKNNTRDIESEIITNNFLKNCKNQIKQAYNKDRLYKKRTIKKGDIKKYISFNHAMFKNISIDYKVIGSKRNPIINFTYLSPRTLVSKDLFGDEQCISLETCSIPVKQRSNGSSIYNFSDNFSCPISIHTINRLLFRLGIKRNTEEGDYKILFDQFKYVPIVSQFYHFIFCTLINLEIIQPEDLKSTTLIFPSIDGLFIGELNVKSISGDMSFDQSVCIKTFIDDELFKGEEQAEVKNELMKIFNQSSNSLENPFNYAKSTVPNKDPEKNIYAHAIYYFSKLMSIQGDFLYLMSKENSQFNETNFFRLNKAFEKLNQIFKELKNKSGLTDNSSIEEIYEKFDINLMEDILWSV